MRVPKTSPGSTRATAGGERNRISNSRNRLTSSFAPKNHSTYLSCCTIRDLARHWRTIVSIWIRS
eukprot:943401-Pleurochrysis_carterae.AAC.1